MQDGDVSKALEYLDKIRSSTEEGYDEKTWAMVIDACNAKGRTSEAIALRTDEKKLREHRS